MDREIAELIEQTCQEAPRDFESGELALEEEIQKMDKPRRYRKRPVTIEAIQWTGENDEAVQAFVGYETALREGDKMLIHTSEGPLNAKVWSWIIRGVQGEFYPCDPEIFHQTYEAAHDEGE